MTMLSPRNPIVFGDVELDAELHHVIAHDIRADLAYGPDLTSQAIVPHDRWVTVEITPRRSGVLAGGPAAIAIFEHTVGPHLLEIKRCADDGSITVPGEPLIVVRGPARPLMVAERTVLNLLSRLSGVATATASWVTAVQGTGCQIRETRKTSPGLRHLEKYAVRQGGGVNHRYGLGDQLLVKDNHIVLAGSVSDALTLAHAEARLHGLPIEIEVNSLAQFDEVLSVGVDMSVGVGMVMLDNMSIEACADAVRRRDAAGQNTLLEASGGLTLDVARAYADTGVDYLAVGAVTHSASALDIGMDVADVGPDRDRLRR